MKDQEYDYFYDDEQDVKYCYPGTNVLKNKLNIRDLDILHEAERDEHPTCLLFGRAKYDSSFQRRQWKNSKNLHRTIMSEQWQV